MSEPGKMKVDELKAALKERGVEFTGVTPLLGLVASIASWEMPPSLVNGPGRKPAGIPHALP